MALYMESLDETQIKSDVMVTTGHSMETQTKRSQKALFCAQLLGRARLFATPWTVAHQAPLSMGIPQARILEWVAMPSSRGSSQPGIEPGSPALQADSLPAELPGKVVLRISIVNLNKIINTLGELSKTIQDPQIKSTLWSLMEDDFNLQIHIQLA